MQNHEELIKYTLDLINEDIRSLNGRRVEAHHHLCDMLEKLQFIMGEQDKASEQEIVQATEEVAKAKQNYQSLLDQENSALEDRKMFLED